MGKLLLVQDSLDKLTRLIQGILGPASINCSFTTNFNGSGNWEVSCHFDEISIEATAYSLAEALSKIALALRD